MSDQSMMQVPAQVRDMAEKTVDQAEKAFGAFLDAANRTMTMMPLPGAELSKTALSMTEQNMKAAFEHARKLLHATDLNQILQLQSEFARQQFSAVQDQVKQLGSQFVESGKNFGETNK